MERVKAIRQMEQQALATANQHCGAANALEALIQEFDAQDDPAEPTPDEPTLVND